MNAADLIHYWKDPEYRESVGMGEAEQAGEPDPPSGTLDLSKTGREAAARGAEVDHQRLTHDRKAFFEGLRSLVDLFFFF